MWLTWPNGDSIFIHAAIAWFVFSMTDSTKQANPMNIFPLISIIFHWKHIHPQYVNVGKWMRTKTWLLIIIWRAWLHQSKPAHKILPASIQQLLCIHDRSWALWWRRHPGWCWNPWLALSALGESAETPADAVWSAERHWTWQPRSSAPVHRKYKQTLKVILIQKTALWLCQTHSS